MTAENVTSTITAARTILRHRLEARQRRRANTRQTRAAARVPHGARSRKAMAQARVDGLWRRKGRMMKAGTKNNPIPARADSVKMNHGKVRRGDGIAAIVTNHFPRGNRSVP